MGWRKGEAGSERVGRTAARRLGGRINRQRNRKMGGPLALDGRRLMGGHNNQPKVVEGIKQETIVNSWRKAGFSYFE